MRSQPASSIMANGYRFRNQAEYKTATCQLPHEGSLPNRRRPYKCLETQPTRYRHFWQGKQIDPVSKASHANSAPLSYRRSSLSVAPSGRRLTPDTVQPTSWAWHYTWGFCGICDGDTVRSFLAPLIRPLFYEIACTC